MKAWLGGTVASEALPANEGNCTVHEVVLFEGPLSDEALVVVYRTLAAKWHTGQEQTV